LGRTAASKNKMTLAATFVIILLFANPHMPGMQTAAFVFQTTQNSQPAEQDQTQPAPSDKPAQSATPPSTDSTPTASPQEPVANPNPETAPPKPVTPKKLPAKTPPKKRKVVHHSTTTPKKKVVRNGGTSDSQVQISSGTGAQQAAQQRKNADSMLDATTANLNKVSGQQLNPSQQDMVKQIHTYMQQSKAAANAGDLQGANNLAVKAHLLSEELVKH
jgi:hypothetical protein